MNLKPRKYTWRIFWGLISLNVVLTIWGFLIGISTLAWSFYFQLTWLLLSANKVLDIRVNIGSTTGLLFLILGTLAVLSLYYIIAWLISVPFDRKTK